jgi:hypothetical protein
MLLDPILLTAFKTYVDSRLIKKIECLARRTNRGHVLRSGW